MPCQAKPCTCSNATLRIFCGYWAEPERPRSLTYQKNIRDWCCLPLAIREKCAEHLRSKVPEAIIAKWKSQSDRGMEIGSDDIRFHLGVGMNVRNALREVCRDSQLPAGQQNWDDFYLGALEALTGSVQ